jgi:hypothetical protein
VLPKIEASRDADAPSVEEVVIKVAERNPQKLRQIGLNYDIANAKGISELTEEQTKKQEQKKKDAAEKKKKKIEEDAKEKEEFDVWKREEKADYDAWKRERARQAIAAPKEDDSKPESKNDKDEKFESKDEKESKSETKDDKAKDKPQPAADQNLENKTDAPTPSTVAEEDTTAKDEAPKTETPDIEHAPEPKHEDTNSGVEAADPTSHDDDDTHLQDHGPPEPHSPPSITNYPAPYRPAYSRHPDSVYDPAPLPPRRSEPTPTSSAPKPWNAVCVLGLRVYTQDPEVSIKLVKPKDAEEGAILDVDGDTLAGATM